MLQSRNTISIRPVVDKDRQQLASLIHFETHVHRHLDWKAPLEWLGQPPCLLMERNGKLAAALVSPPDPPEIAWIRLFAVASEISAGEAWEMLWSEAKNWFIHTPEIVIAALPLQEWFAALLATSGFQHTNDVIMLQWETGNPIAKRSEHPWSIRPMEPDDLPEVERLDAAAFGLLWRNSLDSIKLAFGQAALATVAEQADCLVGYQISTASPLGGHLARLAVHPQQQCRGVGFGLVVDTINQFHLRGAQRITVNTQLDNLASLSLYSKAGFHQTSERYPVYIYQEPFR